MTTTQITICIIIDMILFYLAAYLSDKIGYYIYEWWSAPTIMVILISSGVMGIMVWKFIGGLQ